LSLFKSFLDLVPCAMLHLVSRVQGVIVPCLRNSNCRMKDPSHQNADDEESSESPLQPVHQHRVFLVLVAVRARRRFGCFPEMGMVSVFEGHAEILLGLAPIQICCRRGRTYRCLAGGGSEEGPA